MRKMSRWVLPLVVAAFTAVPVFAAAVDYFLKIDGVAGESTAGGHGGWLELSSFSWGVSRAVPAVQNTIGGTPACSLPGVHSFTFTRRGKASPRLEQMCASHAAVPSVTLEVQGQRHLLQNVSFAQCRSQAMADGSVTETLTLNFSRCATHAMLVPAVQTTNGLQKVTPFSKVQIKTDAPNSIIAILIGLTPRPPEATTLISLSLNGNTATLVRKAGGRQGALEQAFQAKQVIPTISITLNNGQKWTFTGVNNGRMWGDGRTERLSFNFGKVEGPLSGFRNLAYKE